MSDDSRDRIADGIDAVEGAYEFFLAYAAQGITEESNAGRVGTQLRGHLDRMAEAVSELSPALDTLLEEGGLVGGDELRAFGEVLRADTENAGAVLSLIRSRVSISSQLIDNLNASVHVRTLLTDLFILDEVLKLGVDQGTAPETSASAAS